MSTKSGQVRGPRQSSAHVFTLVFLPVVSPGQEDCDNVPSGGALSDYL